MRMNPRKRTDTCQVGGYRKHLPPALRYLMIASGGVLLAMGMFYVLKTMGV